MVRMWIKNRNTVLTAVRRIKSNAELVENALTWNTDAIPELTLENAIKDIKQMLKVLEDNLVVEE